MAQCSFWELPSTVLTSCHLWMLRASHFITALVAYFHLLVWMSVNVVESVHFVSFYRWRLLRQYELVLAGRVNGVSRCWDGLLLRLLGTDGYCSFVCDVAPHSWSFCRGCRFEPEERLGGECTAQTAKWQVFITLKRFAGHFSSRECAYV